MQFSAMFFICFSFLSLVSAQFQFFDNFFGQQQQQQQQQPQAPPRGVDWYSDRVLETHCDSGNYLCPGTLDCVARPVDCPCPDDLVKCVVGESRICISRSEKEQGCGLVDKYKKVRNSVSHSHKDTKRLMYKGTNL